MLDSPYAPPEFDCNAEQLSQLIDAGLCWVAASAKSAGSTPQLILQRLRLRLSTADV